jgi:hypothetical protein
MDQQLTQITVAMLGDAKLSLFAATGVFAWCHSQPSGHLAANFEDRWVTYRGDECGSGKHTYPLDGGEFLALRIGIKNSTQATLLLFQTIVKRDELFIQFSEHFPCHPQNSVLCALQNIVWSLLVVFVDPIAGYLADLAQRFEHERDTGTVPISRITTRFGVEKGTVPNFQLQFLKESRSLRKRISELIFHLLPAAYGGMPSHSRSPTSVLPPASTPAIFIVPRVSLAPANNRYEFTR